jgi:hypothetical protein
MSASPDDLADQILADAAAQMLGAEQVASGSGSQPSAADMAAAMAMAAAAGLSPEEMAELAGGGSPPPPSFAPAAREVAVSSRVGAGASRVAQETILSLALRTSVLCEFRDTNGLLQAFEVCYGQTTFGVLCSALGRMSGLEFVERQVRGWFKRPSRFTFKGELYEASIPYDNIRIAPVDHGKALIEMEELLEYVRHNVLRTPTSRYTLR